MQLPLCNWNSRWEANQQIKSFWTAPILSLKPTFSENFVLHLNLLLSKVFTGLIAHRFYVLVLFFSVLVIPTCGRKVGQLSGQLLGARINIDWLIDNWQLKFGAMYGRKFLRFSRRPGSSVRAAFYCATGTSNRPTVYNIGHNPEVSLSARVAVSPAHGAAHQQRR